MIIKNKKLLAEFRGPGFCELCRAWCQAREPHHILCRGHGGGNRLDVRLNLISLGSAYDCNCHGRYHDGHIPRCRILAVVCRREDVLPEFLLDELYRLRRAPKGTII